MATQKMFVWRNKRAKMPMLMVRREDIKGVVECRWER